MPVAHHGARRVSTDYTCLPPSFIICKRSSRPSPDGRNGLSRHRPVWLENGIRQHSSRSVTRLSLPANSKLRLGKNLLLLSTLTRRSTSRLHCLSARRHGVGHDWNLLGSRVCAAHQLRFSRKPFHSSPFFREAILASENRAPVPHPSSSPRSPVIRLKNTPQPALDTYADTQPRLLIEHAFDISIPALVSVVEPKQRNTKRQVSSGLKRYARYKQKRSQHVENSSIWTQALQTLKRRSLPRTRRESSKTLCLPLRRLHEVQKALVAHEIRATPPTFFGRVCSIKVLGPLSDSDAFWHELQPTVFLGGSVNDINEQCTISEQSTFHALTSATVNGNVWQGEAQIQEPAHAPIWPESSPSTQFHHCLQSVTSREKKQSIAMATSNVLEALSRTLQSRSIMTRTDVRTLLRFLDRHHWASARRALHMLREYGYQLDSSCFEPFLLQCARLGDPFTFFLFVESMAKHGVRPDWGTWAQFLRLSASTAQKKQVLDEMNRRAYLSQTNAAHAIAPELISADLESFLNRGHTTMEFLSILTEHLGTTWLSKPAIYNIVTVLSRRLQYREAGELICQFAKTGAYLPSAAVYEVLLRDCVRQKKIDLVLPVFISALRQFRMEVVPGRDCYERLFFAAWQQNRYNTLRVVWKYAASSGCLTHKMTSRVHQSLLHAWGRKCIPVNLSERKQLSAGCIICGVMPPLQMQRHDSPNHVDDVSEIVQMERDLFPNAIPYRDLPTMLERAMELDRRQEWSKARSSINLFWMVTNAIQIDFRTRILQYRTGSGSVEMDSFHE